MNASPLSGIIAAAHTPFQADGSLHLDIVSRQADHFLRTGLSGVFVAGTTGESQSLTVDERLRLTRRWCEVARGTTLRVVVHVGTNCLADAALLAAAAQQAGAAAIAAHAPSFFKPTDGETLVACCQAIAAGAPNTPFYYYDIPSFTGVSLSVPDFLRQAPATIPTLAGIKYTNIDLVQFQNCLSVLPPGGAALIGVDEILLPALQVGAHGAVGIGYNFTGPLAVRLAAAAARGDLPAARLEQARILRTTATLSGYGYLAAGKAVMRSLGLDVGPARLPLRTLSAENERRLRSELEGLGFYDWVRA